MILFVEGPRACGKTYLIENFIKEVNDPMLEYYKFYFANHIKTLDLKHLEDTPALHYFSLGNIMTIMEMNLRSEYKDKIWVFDRAIISAYAWAVLRKRLTPERAREEYEALLKSPLYSNCKTVFITVNLDRSEQDKARNKDVFDGAHTTDEEMHQLGHFLQFRAEDLKDPLRNNGLLMLQNNFDQRSMDQFTYWGRLLLGIPA